MVVITCWHQNAVQVVREEKGSVETQRDVGLVISCVKREDIRCQQGTKCQIDSLSVTEPPKLLVACSECTHRNMIRAQAQWRVNV